MSRKLKCGYSSVKSKITIVNKMVKQQEVLISKIRVLIRVLLWSPRSFTPSLEFVVCRLFSHQRYCRANATVASCC